MPKLPPPPRKPQKRSGFSRSLAVTSRPSAVTTSASKRLSMASPWRRITQPIPPPNVRPAMLVCDMVPPATDADVPGAERSAPRDQPQVPPGEGL
jgi:hypothetical protein